MKKYDMHKSLLVIFIAFIFNSCFLCFQSVALNATAVGRELISNFGDLDSAGNDMAALDDTIQENVEKYLNNTLSAYSSVLESRALLRGQLINLFSILRRMMNYDKTRVL